MNETQLNKSRSLLNARATELQQTIRRRDGIAIERAADPLDETQLAAERELTTRGLERETRTLRDVQSALLRIDQGSYGTCLSCEEEISEKRLNAVPWATLCINCQELEDHNSHRATDPSHRTLFADAA